MTSYPVLLERAWQDAHAPRRTDARTVVSTFAGCGGSSLGYGMAGWRELLASEWDPHACEVFRRNFPDVPVVEGDIAKLTVERVLDLTGLAPGDLDCLDGSPPCQGFSTSGKRDLADPRSRLFVEFVRLLEGLRPRSLVMENVSGMVRGKMRATFVEVLAALTDAGYRVRVAVLDARYFDVPSTRQRVIFVGLRNDLAGHAPAGAWHPPGHGPVRTVGEAWQNLPSPGLYLLPMSKGMQVVERLQPGDSGSDVMDRLGLRSSYFNTHRLHYQRPAPTIVLQVRTHLAGGLIHPDEDRFAGVHELARLQSFPDNFQWGENLHVQLDLNPSLGNLYRAVHARIGNSVPPLMMRAVAGHLAGLLDQAEARVTGA